MIPTSLTISPPAPPSKRQRPRDGRTLPTLSSIAQVRDEAPPASPGLKLPAFLNQTTTDIAKLFQELEWRQRFRIQHALNNPQSSPFRMEKSPVIFSRNRYGNVQPWDQSRIRLKVPMGGSDYVNASPIRLNSKTVMSGPAEQANLAATQHSTAAGANHHESKYIATQGPKDGHFSHFWNMVMQETLGEQGVIVMLTPCWEGNKEKCGQYFPTSLDAPILKLEPSEAQENRVPTRDDGDPFLDPAPVSASADHDPIEDPSPDPNSSRRAKVHKVAERRSTVTLLESRYEEKSRSEVRKLQLQIGDESKMIWHYLFNGWPDYAKPEGDDRRALLELIKASADQAGDPSLNSRFVHCSAGVGRTGTFIALDYLLRELALGHLKVHSSSPPTSSPPSRPRSVSEQQQQQQQHLIPTSQADRPSNAGSAAGEAKVGSAIGNEKESTPDAKADKEEEQYEEEEEDEGEQEDLVFETVNNLREQRMMMVMNEVQLQFLYEVLREAYIELYHPPRRSKVIDMGVIEDAADAAAAATATARVTGERSPKMARTTHM